MNRRITINPTWRSRILTLLVFAAAVGVASCQENLQSGAACPLLCPSQDVTLRDTVISAVVVDSTLPGFPPIGTETSLLLAARGDTLDTRVIFRFDTITQTFRAPSATVDSVITSVDSSMLRVVLDTATIFGVPGKPTGPVTIELYDVDSPEDTAAAVLLPLFDPSRLLGSKSFAPESLTDTIQVPVSNAAVLDKIVRGAHLRIGTKLLAGTSSQVRIQPQGTFGAALRFKPNKDTTYTIDLVSNTPSDTALAALRSDLADYVIVAKGPPPRPPQSIAVGSYPAQRTYMRFNLPSKIVDSSTVVRASLILTQQPARSSPSSGDSIGIYPMAVTASPAVTDVPRLMQLADFLTTIPVDSARLVPKDSGQKRIELVNLVRVWGATNPATTQRSIVLRVGTEGINPAELQFFSSQADPALRPRIQLTYVPKVALGLP